MLTLKRLKKIASGNTAEVFALSNKQVLKLYFDGYPPDEAENELNKAKFAYLQGIPTPKPIDLLQLGSRQGLVFERCKGPSLAAYLQQHPKDAPHLACEFASLHATIHQYDASPLPITQQRLSDKIYRADVDHDLRQQALEKLETYPQENMLCHGDFHPANVILSVQGLMVIDWVDATKGPALADVARTELLIATSMIVADSFEQQAYVELKQQFVAAYKRHYFQLSKRDELQLARWLPLVAIGRLSEKLAGSSFEQTLAIAQQGLV
ncbi:aminoglycoside phosphotransferase [Agarivorans sp. OAG1]|uniref:aminoglycoside phosphotransferase family protein n=1 Tax=Agarivorans sp. OAG1 TaxID=3082387 RepID=UPI002B314237|nr:aminoglycoside phosphotransferase [Agarivorans sp. OAG1]